MDNGRGHKTTGSEKKNYLLLTAITIARSSFSSAFFPGFSSHKATQWGLWRIQKWKGFLYYLLNHPDFFFKEQCFMLTLFFCFYHGIQIILVKLFVYFGLVQLENLLFLQTGARLRGKNISYTLSNQPTSFPQLYLMLPSPKLSGLYDMKASVIGFLPIGLHFICLQSSQSSPISHPFSGFENFIDMTYLLVTSILIFFVLADLYLFVVVVVQLHLSQFSGGSET